jgi:hypothetical protein
MKTRIKQIKGILIAILLISGITPVTLWSQATKDFYSVKGVVRDKVTQKTLEYASVTITGTNEGTITNSRGEFSIKIKNSMNAKSVEISHLGYATYLMPVNGESARDVTVYLTPKSNLLDEITVYSLDPQELVEKAVSKIKNNYSGEDNMLTGFYRETIRKRHSYINVSEAIVEIFKSPYTQGLDRDNVQIYKGRKLISPKVQDTLLVRLLGGPNLSLYIDVVKNPDLMLSSENIPNYKYEIVESVMIDERPHYVVSFKPQVTLPYALYFGKMYIDKESLAFSRIEFSLSMDDETKATQAILKRKPMSMRFKPEEVSFLVTYKLRNGLSNLNYIRSEVRFKCDWRRRLFSTNYTVVSETVITGGKSGDAKRIPNKLAFNANQSLSDKVTNFLDENFWEDYNIIEPEASLESAVNRLKKQ